MYWEIDLRGRTAAQSAAPHTSHRLGLKGERRTTVALHHINSIFTKTEPARNAFYQDCRNNEHNGEKNQQKGETDPETNNNKRGCEERAAIASPAAAGHTDTMRGTE